ncbi:MAG: hypothetical protein ACYCVH_15910 [Ignavibacteriaceae bacterium]
MLSNKNYLAAILFLSLIFFSCGEKKQNNQAAENEPDFNNPDVVLQQAKNILGSNVKFAYKGLFDADSTLEISAGTEVQGQKEFGIKFILLKKTNGQLVSVFQSPLLNGSFKECLVKKIKFPMFNYELVYYNSQDFYLGSGGGEVFSYIINFKDKKVYYAHLISEPGRPVSLYLSGNIDVAEIKKFFISNFKRDYPTFEIIDNDITLKY